MQALLYANLTSRKVSDSLGGPDFGWPELIEGDTIRLGLRFAQIFGDLFTGTAHPSRNP